MSETPTAPRVPETPPDYVEGGVVRADIKKSRTIRETRKQTGESLVLLLTALGGFGTAIAGVQSLAVQLVLAGVAALASILFLRRAGLIRQYRREDHRRGVR